MAAAKSLRELRVWKNAMDCAMVVFELTKKFHPDERFSLTDQARRSSRSVAANISEAWRKRRYVAAFVSKLNDAEGEAAETQTHFEIARRCGYVTQGEAQQVWDRCDEVLLQLSSMIDHAESRCLKPSAPTKVPRQPQVNQSL